jgi:1-acyl-sn-glycerol-3-phosphate acyltransferase
MIVGWSIRLYYRAVHIRNREYLDHNGPVIIIANHPNTLMDAWMIGHLCKKPIYFLAKSSFFRSRFKKWLLRKLNMIPINRSSDCATRGVSNADSLQACYDILEQGKTLLIFPEGTSMPELKLRELKSGTARIALEVEKRNGGKLNLKIISVGLFYSQAEKFRSSVMVTVGKGMGISEYLDTYHENPSGAAKKLTLRFREQLERVLVTAENDEQERMIHNLFHILRTKEESTHVEKGALLIKRIKSAIEEHQLMRPYLIRDLQELSFKIKWQQEKLAIHSDFISRRFRSRLYLMQLGFSLIFLLLGLPFFLFGMIHNYLTYKVIDLVVPKLSRFVEYHAALNILLSLVLYPLTYVAWIEWMKWYLHPPLWGMLLYLISLPLSGMFAHRFAHYFKRTGQKRRYLFLIYNKKEAVIELQKNKQALEKVLFEG